MSLDRLFPVSARFNLFVSGLPRHPPLDFFPFLSVGSAKVENFFGLPNKIIFIFFVPRFLSAFQYAAFSGGFPFLPNRAAKVAIFFFSANLFQNKLLAFSPSHIPQIHLFTATVSSEAGCKSRKNSAPSKYYTPFFLIFIVKACFSSGKFFENSKTNRAIGCMLRKITSAGRWLS